ncbi:NlpC/P60 family N-terminal domain-containing protein [Geomesophilobacter sediminis]|uniref:SH3 domain-containing protein n=1 Tax=Geomesophilobacter sediminis TaxID=2798584 RepID=A0A8J7J619_9BACT|nr:NlpC/P60 family N-terminal domain-containing protein [Geomesophilobacter sediminis]MBJ6724061.1 SH3 domain-containing protein [Geomesophilobacter sediminis]
MNRYLIPSSRMILVLPLLVLSACTTTRTAKEGTTVIEAVPVETAPEPQMPLFYPDHEVADVTEIPQKLDELAAAAGNQLKIEPACRDNLLREFRSRYFAPWTATHSLYDRADTIESMRQLEHHTWFGVNLRRVDPKWLHELIDSCNLGSFPSRSDLAIAVAPGHLRGLPTSLPLFDSRDGFPFDMLEYPQLKLNEPLRVVHATRDGVWLFVETPYSNGWIQARDVALVDHGFADTWMKQPLAVLVHDQVPITDGYQLRFHAKLGTLFPVVQESPDSIQVTVAGAGDEAKARSAVVTLARKDARSFPVEFTAETVAAVGNQMMGEPYGWGEMYGLRDCSALLRDFFLPFGIWLPRTSSDQIASFPKTVPLAGRTPEEKRQIIRRDGKPFLSILHKTGHIMLYVGTDSKGRDLVLHDAWSVPVKRGEGQREKMIGKVVITTLEPGKELGLLSGRSLVDRISEMGTITDRCGGKR